MSLSYLIITFNRRDGLLQNLKELLAIDPGADVWVVDNASTDGTQQALAHAYPHVRIVRLDTNLGMPARNAALRQMTSEFVAIIDDDSYPTAGVTAKSVQYMRENPDVAAVVGRALLPNGKPEASAFPSILLGCASCVRLSTVKEVGYFPDNFFRQAEEYDLSCRLWNAGYRIARFEDLIYRHDKKPSASRASRVVTSLDLKHNLLIAARYLSPKMYQIYREDFIARYGAIMTHAGYESDIAGVINEADGIIVDGSRLRRMQLNAAAFEAVFQHESQRQQVASWASLQRIRRVAIADYSKNLYATYRACIDAGLEIVAIADDREAFAGLNYRGVNVCGGSAIARSAIDGVVVSNMNPAQVQDVADSVSNTFGPIPTLTLWRGVNFDRQDRVERNHSSSRAA